MRQAGRIQRADRFPRFRRRDERARCLRQELEAEIARCPQVTAALVATVLFERVDGLLEVLGHDGESLAVAVEEVAVCADVEVEPDADIERVQAQIWFEIEQYFNPPIPFSQSDPEGKILAESEGAVEGLIAPLSADESPDTPVKPVPETPMPPVPITPNWWPVPTTPAIPYWPASPVMATLDPW